MHLHGMVKSIRSSPVATIELGPPRETPRSESSRPKAVARVWDCRWMQSGRTLRRRLWNGYGRAACVADWSGSGRPRSSHYNRGFRILSLLPRLRVMVKRLEC